MRIGRVVSGTVLACIVATTPGAAWAQLPLAPVAASGQVVIPVFEGWYRNPDGTFSLSFGYFNRNSQEVIDLPAGASNFIAPGAANQGQPTHFEARRHWGVFAVKVPADFGRKIVTWTVNIRGETYAIPGYLRPEWQIDALEGEVGSGNTPPVLRFAEDGPEARGPAGYTAGPMTASVGTPLMLTVWAKDDGRSPATAAAAAGAGGRGRGAGPQTTLTWFVHQGPGAVVFDKPTATVPAAGGSVTASVTFTVPGEYILRVRANDASGVTGGGHAQCCWTNGFVKVTVTP
jgi:hypothetical protein